MDKNVTPPKAMPPEELRDALARAGLGQSEFARLTGRTPSAIRNYLQGFRPVSGDTALLVRILAAHPELKAEAIALMGLTQEDITPPVGAAAHRKRRKDDHAAPGGEPAPVPLAERWAEDDGAGVRGILPDGKEVVLGAEKGEQPAAEGAARTLPVPNADEVAKRMAAFRKSLSKQGKGRK